MSDNKTGVIEMGRKELDPAEERAYRDRILKARGGVDALKSSDPVGGNKPQIPLLKRPPSDRVEEALQDFSSWVQPRPPGSPVLRPETVRQLEEAAKASTQAAPATTAPEEPEKKEEKPEEKPDEDFFEGFDFSGKNEAQRILDNKKRRKAIEDRCKPMSFKDLLERDEVRQVVPIRPGEFEPEFRSITPEESLFIKQYMAKEENRSEMYLLEKYGLCQLACALVSLNGNPYTPHLNRDGEVDQDVFKKKIKNLARKSGYIVADLALNYHWFDLRVRQLINVSEVGNG